AHPSCALHIPRCRRPFSRPRAPVSLEPFVMSLPRVLPAWVSQVSMYLEELDDATANAIALPSAYLMATPERQRAYRVGRVCASRALEQIGVRGAMPAVHENGGPAWPNATVGPITPAMSLVA